MTKGNKKAQPRQGRRRAVVLLSLGGPDGPEAVQPFLRNLFSDPAILPLPFLLRWYVSRRIAARRTPVTQEMYARIGGRSPLLDETRAQARALEDAFKGGQVTRVFVAMRYAPPFAGKVVKDILDFAADELVLLPLYPQYSTATTETSLKDFARAFERQRMNVPCHTIPSWPDLPGFIEVLADRLLDALGKIPEAVPRRILFSAHGLPQRTIDKGDPYSGEIRKTVDAVLAVLATRMKVPPPEACICYQGRSRNIAWLEPSLKSEIDRAGADGSALVVVPVSFVSEHIETLVELDLDAAERARGMGVPMFLRTACVGTHPRFIEALSRLVEDAAL